MKKENLKKAYKAATDIYYKAGLDNMNMLRMSTIKEVLLQAATEAYGLKEDHWWGYVDNGSIENMNMFCADDVLEFLTDRFEENGEAGDSTTFEIVLLDANDEVVETQSYDYTIQSYLSNKDQHGTY